MSYCRVEYCLLVSVFSTSSRSIPEGDRGKSLSNKDYLMKLTLVGGGGVRSPLFVMSLLNWQARIGIDELCLMDIDPHKLEPVRRPLPPGRPARR